MAARLGLDTTSRVWQMCKGVDNLGLKSVYFYYIISNKSFYTLPPDEYNKTYSDEELKCAVQKENGNGMNKHFSKVPKKARLEVDIVHDGDLDVTVIPPILPTPTTSRWYVVIT
jgi:hypothetical protein